MRARIGFNVWFRYLHTKTEYIQPDCHYFKIIMNDLSKLNTTNIYVNNFNTQEYIISSDCENILQW